jgi:hypothetical protein
MEESTVLKYIIIKSTDTLMLLQRRGVTMIN